jgi:hypothetical protein
MAYYSPTAEQCIVQWQHNRAFIQSVDAKYHDWIITGTLYTALHAIEALLIADQVPNHATHRERHQILQRNPRYATTIYPSYKVMYDLAHITRYSAMPRRWTSYASLDAIIFSRCLYPVENEVRRLLAGMKAPVAFPAAGPIALKS